MKLSLLFVLLFFISINAQAAALYIQDPCTKENHLIHNQKNAFNLNVGKLSLDIFILNNIPHIGEEWGINSIFETPIGDENLEIISDTDMRAWGWCYSINGEMPNMMPNLVHSKNVNDEILWYFSYSYFHKDQWLNMCPFDNQTVPPFCK